MRRSVVANHRRRVAFLPFREEVADCRGDVLGFAARLVRCRLANERDCLRVARVLADRSGGDGADGQLDE